jgi:hypothetical protein
MENLRDYSMKKKFVKQIGENFIARYNIVTMIYRIMLFNGPEDGDTIIAENPWYEVTTSKGNVYLAELDENNQPVMDSGDLGEGHIQAITCNGDIFSPPVQTIKMYFSHKK